MPRETTGKDTREQDLELAKTLLWDTPWNNRAVAIAEAITNARREESNILLDRIIATLKEYPKLGGDIRIMAEVDRIRREGMEEAAGINDYHRVMGLLRRTKMEHGEGACTRCAAEAKLDAEIAAYKGAPVYTAAKEDDHG